MKDIHDITIELSNGIIQDGLLDGLPTDDMPIPNESGCFVGPLPGWFDKSDERALQAALKRLDIHRVDAQIRKTVVRTIEALSNTKFRVEAIHPSNKALINQIVLDIYNKYYS